MSGARKPCPVVFVLCCSWSLSLLAAEGPAPRLALLEPAAFDRAAAAHLLARAGFGGTPEEIDACAALGLERAVEKLLDLSGPDPLPPFEASAPELPSRRQLAGLSREERQKLMRERTRNDAQQFQRLRAWWLRRMVLSPRPLEEKMTLFWHGHFTSSQREVRNSYHMYLQNQLLRSRALGSFKELTRQVAKDPAMLRYLDNDRNNRRAPNENFARELLELFTLGLGAYGEPDIKEAARALTGWTVEGDRFVFQRRAHDPGEKTFLGRTGRFTGDEVIDIIFEQPAASRSIARKLFEFFAHPEPPGEAIEALAATLRESGFEVRPVLSRLFRSAEFYSSRARGTRVKSPVELVAGTLRLLKIDPGDSPAPAFLAGQMGQDLFLPPNVKGWEGGAAWISTASLFDRYNFSRPLLGLDSPARPDAPRKDAGGRFAGRPGGRLPQWEARAAAREILGGSPEEVGPEEAVERVLARFLLVPMGEEGKKKLVVFYQGADPRRRVGELIHLVLSSPEYQLN